MVYNTHKKNRMIPATRKHTRKKKCIIKKKNICVSIEINWRDSNASLKKDCKKKTKIVSPLRRKKRKRAVCPQPEINITVPQGPQGPQGPPGPTGPAGPIIIPKLNTLLTANRYLFIVDSDVTLPTVIPANQFTNDENESIAEFIDLDQNSYANLYMNGIMQVGASYSVSTNALAIINGNDTIFAGTPILLEIVRLSIQIIS